MVPVVDTVTPTCKTIQNRLTVTGPVSGTDSVDVVSNLHAEILEIPVKEGDKVTKGQTLAVLDDSYRLQIENLDNLELEIKVSEYSIGKVEVGQEAEITADILNGEPVYGKVVSISPTGEEKGGSSSERVIPTKLQRI